MENDGIGFGWAIILFVMAGGILALIWWLKGRNRTNAQENRRLKLQVKYPKTFPYLYKQAGRPTMQSVDEIPEWALQTITNAVKTQMKNARQPQYYPYWKEKPIENVVISFIESAGDGEDGLPDIFVRQGINNPKEDQSYPGTRTAGTVIGIDAFTWHRKEIVLPSFKANGWTAVEYLWNASFNEDEHLDEYEEEPNVAIRYAGTNDAHPHRPIVEGMEIFPPVFPPNQIRSFAATVFDPNRQIRPHRKCAILLTNAPKM